MTAIGLVLLGQPAQAASIRIGPGARIDVPLRSLKDLRDENLVKQRFDYSCGAAALATILRYGFGDEVTERDILTDLFDLLSEDEEGLRREQGFSLLDLQHVAQARGYKAQGFPLAPEGGLPQPEILTVREMLAGGNPLLRPPIAKYQGNRARIASRSLPTAPMEPAAVVAATAAAVGGVSPALNSIRDLT